MVPRTEMAAINVDASMQEVVRMLRRFRHSRFPVYEGTHRQRHRRAVGQRPGRAALGGQSQQTVASAGLRRLLQPPVLVPEGAERPRCWRA